MTVYRAFAVVCVVEAVASAEWAGVFPVAQVFSCNSMVAVTLGLVPVRVVVTSRKLPIGPAGPGLLAGTGMMSLEAPVELTVLVARATYLVPCESQA